MGRILSRFWSAISLGLARAVRRERSDRRRKADIRRARVPSGLTTEERQRRRRREDGA
jgi:hypothetical protein